MPDSRLVGRGAKLIWKGKEVSFRWEPYQLPTHPYGGTRCPACGDSFSLYLPPIDGVIRLQCGSCMWTWVFDEGLVHDDHDLGMNPEAG